MTRKVVVAVCLIVLLPLWLMLFAGTGGGKKKDQQVGTGDPANVPPQYLDVVKRAGSICPEITPSLIAAQIEAESNWNVTSTSTAGTSTASCAVASSAFPSTGCANRPSSWRWRGERRRFRPSPGRCAAASSHIS